MTRLNNMQSPGFVCSHFRSIARTALGAILKSYSTLRWSAQVSDKVVPDYFFLSSWCCWYSKFCWVCNLPWVWKLWEYFRIEFCVSDLAAFLTWQFRGVCLIDRVTRFHVTHLKFRWEVKPITPSFHDFSMRCSMSCLVFLIYTKKPCEVYNGSQQFNIFPNFLFLFEAKIFCHVFGTLYIPCTSYTTVFFWGRCMYYKPRSHDFSPQVVN